MNNNFAGSGVESRHRGYGVSLTPSEISSTLLEGIQLGFRYPEAGVATCLPALH